MMMTQPQVSKVVASGADTLAMARTRALLLCGMLAGPIYVVVGAAEMIWRPGFDLRRHPLSLLSNGEWGWVHIAMLIFTGLLTIAGAVGLSRALNKQFGSIWAPLLLGVYGAGLIGAGVFVADPAMGFPLGTPEDANTISFSGIMHFVTGSIGFVGLIGACVVFAIRDTQRKQHGWALFSRFTAVFFGTAFFGIAAGGQFRGAALAFVMFVFTAAVILGWAWVTLTLIRVRRDLDANELGTS